jgi:hypothetical protein
MDGVVESESFAYLIKFYNCLEEEQIIIRSSFNRKILKLSGITIDVQLVVEVVKVFKNDAAKPKINHNR